VARFRPPRLFPLSAIPMPDQPEVRFESALAELEEIVDALQRGEPELDAALAKYQKGVDLLGRCYGLLENAERSVAVLTGLDESGEPLTASFDPTATIDLARTAAATLVANVPAEPEPEPAPAKPRRRHAPKAAPASEAEPETAPKPETAPEPEPEYDRFDPPF